MAVVHHRSDVISERLVIFRQQFIRGYRQHAWMERFCQIHDPYIDTRTRQDSRLSDDKYIVTLCGIQSAPPCPTYHGLILQLSRGIIIYASYPDQDEIGT